MSDGGRVARGKAIAESGKYRDVVSPAMNNGQKVPERPGAVAGANARGLGQRSVGANAVNRIAAQRNWKCLAAFGGYFTCSRRGSTQPWRHWRTGPFADPTTLGRSTRCGFSAALRSLG